MKYRKNFKKSAKKSFSLFDGYHEFDKSERFVEKMVRDLKE